LFATNSSEDDGFNDNSQFQAWRMLPAIRHSQTKQEASKAFDLFVQTVEAKDLSAIEGP
jgi:hypothetical protein